MAANVVHFAIHADDVERARRFYEAVFGWWFEALGPPGFYRVHTGSREEPGIHGALHARHEPLSGTGMRGYECTISVDDLDAITEAVTAQGGTLVRGATEIPAVGTLITFTDPEGNVVNAMRYDTPPLGL